MTWPAGADGGGGDAADAGRAPRCEHAEDCDDHDGCCWEGVCLQGRCALLVKPSCCSDSGACGALSPRHEATCTETCVEGGCTQRLALPAEGCDEEIWAWTPGAQGGEGWELEDDLPGDRVAWHLSGRRGLAGGPSLFAGDALCPTYHTGPLDAACQPLDAASASAVRLVARGPTLALPEGRPLTLLLWLWLELEPSSGRGTEADAYDGLEVRLRTEAGYALLRWSSRTAGPPSREWRPILIDLGDLAGQTIAVELVFETLDGVDNHHEGVYVGGLRVATACAAQRSCPPEAPCAIGTLVPVTPLADALCVVAPPDPGEPCVPCLAPSDCGPASSCLAASCEAGRCSVTPTGAPGCCTRDDLWPGPRSFEGPLDATWELPLVADAGWHLSRRRAHTGTHALRFGVLDSPTLAPAGQAAAGIAWSPPFLLAAEAFALRFHTWLSTEWDAWPGGPNPAGVDRLQVLVHLLDPVDLVALPLEPATVWTSDEVGLTTLGQWVGVSLSLAAFAGRAIRVGWQFDTVDESANDAEGAYIDDVAVTRTCPATSPDREPSPSVR